jgi:hypothetical protein
MKSYDHLAGWHNLATFLTIKGALTDFSLKKHAPEVESAEHLAETIRDHVEYKIAKIAKTPEDFRRMSRIISDADFAQIARFMFKHGPVAKKNKSSKDAKK